MSFITRSIGSITVEETKGVVTIYNIPVSVITRDIEKLWSTSKINKYLFKHIGKNKLSFYSFFTVEVKYILNQLLESRDSRTNVRALRKILNLLDTETWLKRINEPKENIVNLKQLDKFNCTPLDFQKDFFGVYNHNVPRYGLNGYLLAAGAGSGKTIASCMLAECLESDLVIVVSPKNAIDRVWKKTLDTRYNEVPKYWISGGLTTPGMDLRYAVFHYEALELCVGWITEVMERKPGLKVTVILDECHNLNELESLRTQRFLTVCKIAKSKNILWMSGTPIKAVGSEAIPFLTAIDPLFGPAQAEALYKVFGKSATRANDILCHRIGLSTFKVATQDVVSLDISESDYKFTFPGADNFKLSVIRDEISKFVEERFKFYKENRKRYEDIYNEAIAIHKAGLRASDQRDFLKYQSYIATIRKGFDPVAHKELAKFCNQYEKQKIAPDLDKELKKLFLDARSVVKYVELKIRGEALGRVLGRKRIECFVAMANHAELGDFIDSCEKKTVVFASNVETVDAIISKLSADGYQPLVVYGSTNKNLNQIINKFAADEDANPLVATFDSLSTAVPLVMANGVILFNQPFRDYERNQAIARVARNDQDSRVKILNVLLNTGGEVNISTRNLDIVEWSRQQVDSIMGTSGTDGISIEELDDGGVIDGLFDSVFAEEWESIVKQVVPEEVALPVALKGNFFFFK